MNAIHQYQIYIRATPEQVWQAITDPAFTRHYFFGTSVEMPTEPGPYRYTMESGTAVDGEVEAIEAPQRLTMTWQIHYDPEMAAEKPSRVEWVLEAAGEGVTRLRVVHRDLALSPKTWAHVADGWVYILDGMKTLLETGSALPMVERAEPVADPDGEWHRSLAVAANNSTWDLLEKPERSAAETEEMINRAHAAAYHWARAARRGPINAVRANYLLGKVWAAAGVAEPALRYAQQCFDGTQDLGLGDFDLAYAHEVLARAAKVAGDSAAAEEHWAAAKAVPIANDEDRAILEADLAKGL